jgi:hypothetical protein
MSSQKKKSVKDKLNDLPPGPLKQLFANDDSQSVPIMSKFKKLFNMNTKMVSPKIEIEDPRINFKKLLQKQKERTEKNMPFTL